jgi:hypothetical protein
MADTKRITLEITDRAHKAVRVIQAITDETQPALLERLILAEYQRVASKGVEALAREPKGKK